MNKKKQRIAIADACGWEIGERWNGPGNSPVTPWGRLKPKDWTTLPDYLNDLNAMHEAEKTLYGMQCNKYAWGLGLTNYTIAHATAAQRAEAFLRTIGKWEEE